LQHAAKMFLVPASLPDRLRTGSIQSPAMDECHSQY